MRKREQQRQNGSRLFAVFFAAHSGAQWKATRGNAARAVLLKPSRNTGCVRYLLAHLHGKACPSRHSRVAFSSLSHPPTLCRRAARGQKKKSLRIERSRFAVSRSPSLPRTYYTSAKHLQTHTQTKHPLTRITQSIINGRANAKRRYAIQSQLAQLQPIHTKNKIVPQCGGEREK